MSNENAVYGFVQRKIKLLDEDTSWSRAMLAKLRRGVGKPPGASPDVWAVTLSDAPDEWHSRDGSPSFAENAVHATLTLYALHRQGKERGMSVCGRADDGRELGDSVGAAAARLVQADESNLGAVKRRFDRAVTSAGFSELSRHVVGIVQLLKAGDRPLDYPRFALELFWFQHPGREDMIRLRWGEDFYRVLGANKSRKDEIGE